MISRLIVFTCSVVLLAQTTAGPVGSLAYRHAGEIWAQPDGARVQVSQGGGEFPQWSASGRWLSFHQNEKFIVAAADGSRRDAVTLDAVGVWSPAKDELAFAAGDGLTILSFEGNPQRKRIVDGDAGDIAWSPDGTRLAFLKNGRLWRVNADGTDPKPLFAPNQRDAIVIRSWSSDGKYVVVSIDPEHSASLMADGLPLAFVPADGGRAHTFSSNVLFHSDFLSASPEHAEILVSAGGGRESWSAKRITSVDPATGRFAYLTSASESAVSPAWSPEGSRIAYVSAEDFDRGRGGDPVKNALSKRRIWIMNADGSQKRRLTSDPRYRDEYPQWSRDGRYVLFARIDGQNASSIWASAVATGELQRILDFDDKPDPSAWFGYYGYINWARSVAWRPE